MITSQNVNIVTVSLPKEKTASLKVAWTRADEKENSITCAIIKDAGDDPDVTHGAEICSTVSFTNHIGNITIDGGKGVGIVTKPGLGLVLNKAAINPIPMKMIEHAVREVAAEHLTKYGIKVVVSVPNGEELAKKTDNPRLGILGGISILGTTGIVLPYSTASFAASIRQSLDVSLAMGTDTIILSTGGRSEDFARETCGKLLPDHAFVQMGDFAGYAVSNVTKGKFKKRL